MNCFNGSWLRHSWIVWSGDMLFRTEVFFARKEGRQSENGIEEQEGYMFYLRSKRMTDVGGKEEPLCERTSGGELTQEKMAFFIRTRREEDIEITEELAND